LQGNQDEGAYGFAHPSRKVEVKRAGFDREDVDPNIPCRPQRHVTELLFTSPPFFFTPRLLFPREDLCIMRLFALYLRRFRSSSSLPLSLMQRNCRDDPTRHPRSRMVQHSSHPCPVRHWRCFPSSSSLPYFSHLTGLRARRLKDA